MAPFISFRKLYRRFVRTGSGSHRRVRSRQRCRVTLETLEDRCVLSTFTVTNLSAMGPGSLYQAILDANNTPGANTINFAPGVSGTITMTSGVPMLSGNIDLEGPGPAALTVQANGGLSTVPGAVTTVAGLTITNPVGPTPVISINHATLTVNNCIIANCPDGGVQSVGGLLGLHNCTIAGNGSFGIYNLAGTMLIDTTTISGNTANTGQYHGGGIWNTGTLTIRNSTVAGNNAPGYTYYVHFINNWVHVPGSGAGIWNSGTLTITSSTIAGNHADIGGGILSDSAGAVTVRDSIIAQNQAPNGPDVSGAVTSLGNNLVGDGTASSGFTGPADQVGTSTKPMNPMLGPLQNNGGPTATMALLAGSPAIAAGDSTNAPTTDQRGLPRQTNPAYDIGSVAYNVAPSTERFVAAVYLDLLHRPADTAGLIGWSQQLDSLVAQGVPLPQAQSHIVWCIENDGGHEYFTNVVVSCYQQYLGRLPGASDMPFVASEVNYLAATVPAYPQLVLWPYAQVRLSFLTSPEYAQWHGGSDNAGFVEGLYQSCLGRSAAGDVSAASYVQLLNAGMITRTQVAQAVLLSTECETNQVIGWYEDFLGRTPSTAGDLANVRLYAQALQEGIPEAGLIASMLGGPGQEYFNKALP
jgi:hypothetical protein